MDHYSECYAFGDDIHPVMKVLNEQRHLSCKEIHPHNMDMCEDQIEKQEKVRRYEKVMILLKLGRTLLYRGVSRGEDDKLSDDGIRELFLYRVRNSAACSVRRRKLRVCYFIK